MDTEDHNSDPDQSDYFLKFFLSPYEDNSFL